MDLTLNNNIETNDKINNDVTEFMLELENSLEMNEIVVGTELYNYIYNELDLAQKYKAQLENIIKQSMFEYSSQYDFFYLYHDEKGKKYYVDCYNGEEGGLANRVEVTKKDIEAVDWEIGKFYSQVSEDEVVEDDGIAEAIKDYVGLELEYMEEKNENGK